MATDLGELAKQLEAYSDDIKAAIKLGDNLSGNPLDRVPDAVAKQLCKLFANHGGRFAGRTFEALRLSGIDPEPFHRLAFTTERLVASLGDSILPPCSVGELYQDLLCLNAHRDAFEHTLGQLDALIAGRGGDPPSPPEEAWESIGPGDVSGRNYLRNKHAVRLADEGEDERAIQGELKDKFPHQPLRLDSVRKSVDQGRKQIAQAKAIAAKREAEKVGQNLTISESQH